MRVILLQTAVSSRKTKRFGLSFGCRFRKALRSAATSGRSCSAACRLFFKGQFQMTQKAEDRRLTGHDLGLRQLRLQLSQRNVRLLHHPLFDSSLVRRQHMALVTAELRGPDTSGFTLPLQKAYDRTETHMMSVGRFLQGRAVLNRNNHACAQIARIGLRHPYWPPLQYEA